MSHLDNGLELVNLKKCDRSVCGICVVRVETVLIISLVEANYGERHYSSPSKVVQAVSPHIYHGVIDHSRWWYKCM